MIEQMTLVYEHTNVYSLDKLPLWKISCVSICMFFSTLLTYMYVCSFEKNFKLVITLFPLLFLS